MTPRCRSRRTVGQNPRGGCGSARPAWRRRAECRPVRSCAGILSRVRPPVTAADAKTSPSGPGATLEAHRRCARRCRMPCSHSHAPAHRFAATLRGHRRYSPGSPGGHGLWRPRRRAGGRAVRRHLAADDRRRLPLPRPPTTPPGGNRAPVTHGAAPKGADRLVAVCTLMRSALVDDGQFARAAEFCARRRSWSRRTFAGVTHFGFRSASVYAAPDARTLILKARVRVRAG